MTKLKTLRDLDTKLVYNGNETPSPYQVIEDFKDLLKSEAIKWVKSMGKTIESEWIKHFFNLKEGKNETQI